MSIDRSLLKSTLNKLRSSEPLLSEPLDPTDITNLKPLDSHTPTSITVPRVHVEVEVLTKQGLNSWSPIRFGLDSGADISVMPAAYARLVGVDFERSEERLCYLSFFGNEFNNVPPGELDSLVRSGRVIRGYKNRISIRLGREECRVPIVICDETGPTGRDVPVLLGREGIWDRFYFSITSGISNWGLDPVGIGEVCAWVLQEDNEPENACLPLRIDAEINVNGTWKANPFVVDTRSDYTLIPRRFAEDRLGLHVSSPFKRGVRTAGYQTVTTSNGQYGTRGHIEGSVQKLTMRILDHEFATWCMLYETAQQDRPELVLGVGILEEFVVAFGAGPSGVIPSREVAD